MFQLCFLCCLLLLQNATGQDELTITYREKIKLDQLRELVVNRVPHSYMSEDWQLLKWLRVTKFDVSAAERRIMETVKWREDNKMDSILDEDWSDFDGAEFKVTVEGCKEGRPVVGFDIGDWPTRQIALAGKRARFLRFTDKIAEQGAVLIRKLQNLGHNVTQFVDLYDFSNFNTIEHLCFQCLPIYIYIAQTSEKNYPLLTNKTIMTNVPSAYLTVHQILLGFASDESKESWVLYGRDNNDWKERLRKEFGTKNISPQFGGTKDDIYDIEDILKDPSLFKCH